MLISIKDLIVFFLLFPLSFINSIAAEQCKITRTIQANQWAQIGIPCAPPQDKNTLKDILSDDIPGEYGVDWAVYAFNLTANEYDQIGLGIPLEIGKGYWVIHLDQDVQLDMPEGSQPVDVKSSTQCLTAGCFESIEIGRAHV